MWREAIGIRSQLASMSSCLSFISWDRVFSGTRSVNAVVTKAVGIYIRSPDGGRRGWIDQSMEMLVGIEVIRTYLQLTLSNLSAAIPYHLLQSIARMAIFHLRSLMSDLSIVA